MFGNCDGSALVGARVRALTCWWALSLLVEGLAGSEAILKLSSAWPIAVHTRAAARDAGSN